MASVLGKVIDNRLMDSLANYELLFIEQEKLALYLKDNNLAKSTLADKLDLDTSDITNFLTLDSFVNNKANVKISDFINNLK
jgi:hypothetical protein